MSLVPADLKPANILLKNDGSYPCGVVAKLTVSSKGSNVHHVYYDIQYAYDKGTLESSLSKCRRDHESTSG